MTASGFAAITASIKKIADRVCHGKIVCCLEGGYHLDGLSQAVKAVLNEMAGVTDTDVSAMSAKADKKKWVTLFDAVLKYTDITGIFFNGLDRGGIMDKIKIMEASVRKWQKIIDKKGSDGGVLDCPPCRIYYFFVCIGCPIAEYTGKKFCKGSPYIPWFRHQLEKHDKLFRKIYCPECEKLARDMQDFMVEIRDHLKQKEAVKTEDKEC